MRAIGAVDVVGKAHSRTRTQIKQARAASRYRRLKAVGQLFLCVQVSQHANW